MADIERTSSRQSTGAGAPSVSVSQKIDEIAEPWDALVEEASASPFMRPGWVSAWLDAFSPGPLELLVARRGDRLQGVLPLVRRRGALLSPTNWHSPEFGVVAVDGDVRSALAIEALSRARTRLDLMFVTDHDPFFEDLRQAASGTRHRRLVRVLERSPFIELGGDWEEFERRLGSKRRSDLRRRRRRLEESGEVRFEVSDGREELDRLLREGFAVEASGWKGQGGTAIASDSRIRAFYEEVARWAANGGWLRLWFLRLDGRPIAFAFCVVHGDSHYVVKIGIEPEFARFGPGHLLTREMLEHAFADGLRRYEFLGDADPYKMEWTDRCHDRWRVQLFAPTSTGAVNRLLWKRGRPIAKRVISLVRR